ncbi:hypothetical protein BXY82_1851 [Gelidibacter sediminis]|uniref:Uncharacterized protein n=1 Tax=Gelidibacter sediminis TaxID=1608710 RepID=A0A4R7PZT6_9FLAO|nr:hypothetical protein [Gelidibacter sediminis]TDU39819.1 hypothetical protein BXY82_1851 [Gelidibacter sediminis]
MGKVNYIIHMNAAFERFDNDARIKQGHITLYLAFFQKWNREFFKDTLTINSALIMESAKIKSKTTYHNYLKDLNDWGYLHYFPSYHPARGSIVKMPIFGTTDGTGTVQKLANSVPEPGQNMVSFYKHKTKENLNKQATPFNEFEVLLFFKENKWNADEGKKFYAHYRSRNLELGRGQKMQNWKTAARRYVEEGFVPIQERTNPISGFLDNLKSGRNKNYDEPL